MKHIYKKPPKAAWKKELGDVDCDKTEDTLADRARYVDRTAVGIPLGGFGTGAFEYNITGSFGPWQMDPGKLERRFLDSAAFHVRERMVLDEKDHKESLPEDILVHQNEMPVREAITKTLVSKCKLHNSRNLLVPQWRDHQLEIGSADYYALYPKGWIDYKDNFNSDLNLEFFSPIIANNYRESSLPIAYFVFNVSNPTEETLDISVMFTFPNMSVYREKEDNPFITAIIGALGVWGDTVDGVNRYGLKNEVVAKEDVVGIVMTSDSERNERKVQKSEFCISALKDSGVELSWCANWDTEKDSKLLWDIFDSEGSLSDINETSENPAGALCARFKLEPGETREVKFALTWNFPVVEVGTVSSGEYQQWWKKYTEFYPPSDESKEYWNPDKIQPQAFNIAYDGLLDIEKNHNALDNWMQPYLSNPEFIGKEWVLTCAFNELCYNSFGGSFWENGLIESKYTDFSGEFISTNVKKFGNRDYRILSGYEDIAGKYQQKEQCLHYTLEAQEFPFAETFDVRAHSHRVYTDLWPEIERDILLVYKDFIMDDKEGACAHDAGSTKGGAFFAYDYYFDMITKMNPGAYSGVAGKRNTTPWSEFSPKFILYSYEYWEKNRDKGFLKDIWEAVVKSYIYQRKTDTDNDGLTNMKSSEYDKNDLFNSVLWVAALEAVIKLCETDRNLAEAKVEYKIKNANQETIICVNDTLMSDAKKELDRARLYIENVLWNQEHGCYIFNAQTPVLMADAFIGERLASNAGLEPTVDKKRLASHYKKVYECNVGRGYDKRKSGFGHCGARNLASINSNEKYSTADGVVEHANDVWTGVTYVLSANMYQLGKELNDIELMTAALDTAHGVYYTTYEDCDTAYYFNTPEAWNSENPRLSRNRLYQRARGAWELLRSVMGK